MLWFNKEKEQIPQKFHSFTTGKAFDHCLLCDKYLLEDGTKYMIEKAIKKYPDFNTFDIIFEFAICEECGNKMRGELSEKSLAQIEAYFSKNNNRIVDLSEMYDGKSISEIFTNKCIVKNKEEAELTEYQLIAYCDGGRLSNMMPPILLSEAASSEIQELVSPETRDELNKFSDDFLGLPPEWKEILKDEFVLI